MKVQLILCSYNGARYLIAQLDSILKQTETRFRLLISDDCSTDGTAELAAGYVERFPERVELWRRTEASGGAARHFLSVLKAYGEKCCAGDADMGADGSGATGAAAPDGKETEPAALRGAADYIMFADQDDDWHPDKIERTLQTMQHAEAQYGRSTPLLVHCDMRVTDAAGAELASSYVRYQGMSPERNRLNQLLVQNNVTGGALMMNRALAELLWRHPLPECAVMHDHWIALVAAAFGKIIFLDAALYDYRQHGENVLGAAKGSRVREILDRLGLFRKDGRTRAEMNLRSQAAYAALFSQAAELFRQYGKELPAAERRTLREFLSLRHKSRAGKIYGILRCGFTFNRFHRTVGECLFL